MQLTPVGQPLSPELTALDAAGAAANKLPYYTSATAAALADFTAGGRALVNSAGTANTFPYFSASNTVTLASITAAGLAILDDADASAQRTTLGLAIGTNVQAYDATLAALAAHNTNGILTQTAADTFTGRTLAGTPNQVVITNGDGVSGNPTFALPQDIATTSDVQFGTVGWGTSGGILAQHSTISDMTLLWPEGTAGLAAVSFRRAATTADTGGDQSQMGIGLYAPISLNAGAQGANYWNTAYSHNAADRASPQHSLAAFEDGAEGNWTYAGGFTQKRRYLWEFDAAAPNGLGYTIWYVDLTNPQVFIFSDPAASTSGEQGTSVHVGGKRFGNNASTGQYSLEVSGLVDKTNAGGQAFTMLNVKPTLNTTGSNASTVTLLNLDTTNTSTTGLTTVLMTAGYGGSEVGRLTSAGNLGLGTTAPESQVHIASDAFGIFMADTLVASTQGSGLIFRKGRGTRAAPRRTKSADVLGFMNARGYTAVDDSTTAAVSTSNAGQLRYIANEDFTTSAQGANLEIRSIGTGTTTLATRAIVGTTGISIGTATAARGTTDPTNALNIFDGTAPVGTLTNGVSLHSASGKLKSVDAAGLAGWVVSASAANTVSPTSPNRTLTVEVNGTTYYIHCKTTND